MQISANLRNKLQEYTQSPDKITQKYERIHSFTKRTVRSFRKFEVRVCLPKFNPINLVQFQIVASLPSENIILF